MIEYYLPGYSKIFWISVALAGIAFVLVTINKRTRPALLFPVVLAVVSAGPYLMFLFGASMTDRELTTVYRALFAAPWIFIVASAAAASIYFLRAAKHADRVASREGGKSGAFWWGLNLVFPFAVLLTAIPYVANSDWLYMMKPLRDLIFSQGHTIRFLLLGVVLNYFIVAALVAAVLYALGTFRWVDPAIYGKGALLLTNGLELIRALLIAYFIYAWRDESFFIRVSEINQLFVWPLRFAEVIAIGTMVFANILYAKSNRPLQPTR